MSDDKNIKSESASVEERPKRIGPYRILDVLGEGGMSVVYLAEQSEPVKRRVALKILKPGMDSKQVVARFESERQALALLDHPNIAKIFDGGIAESGRPYFVMEQVKGVPITDYCDDQKLSNEERLTVFINVCSAVQHAHLKGLIHRDLKPSNILVGVVDSKPQPKIIDFGIAKATSTTLTERTLFTKIGQVIGTPQYMSPEQADLTGLDIDTRTDIYSLGVVLYELLIGTVPLDLRAIGDQAMQIALKEKDPPKPSTKYTSLGETREDVAKARSTDAAQLVRELRGDLDWIVMRAIEKDRTRRYETVNALGMECRRYLKHEPVLARPPRPGYLLQRFVRRNRLVVAAATVAILAIIAGAGAATLGYIRATEAEKAAVQEAETARQVSDFLVELFEVSDPGEVRGNTITAREVLDRGSSAIETDLADQPGIQTTMMLTMAEVYKNLGLYHYAETLTKGALDIRRETEAENSLGAAEALSDLSEILILLGRYNEAEILANEALGIQRSEHGEIHEDVGDTLNVLGTIDYYQAEYENSLRGFSAAYEILQQTRGPNDPATIDAMSSLGSLYWRMGDLERAEQLARAALQRLTAIEGENHPDVAVIMSNLAILLGALGRGDEAEPFYLKSLEIQRNILGEHALVANTMNNVGMYFMRYGNLEEAEPLMLEALAMWTRTLGPDNPKVHIANHNLGQLYIEKADYAEAERRLVMAVEGRGRLSGSQHEDVAISRMFLCDVYNLTNRYQQCHEIIPGVVQILENTLPAGHSRIAASQIRLAMSLGGLGRFEEAEPIMLQGYGGFTETIPENASAWRARRWVVRFYDLWGKPEEAAKYR